MYENVRISFEPAFENDPSPQTVIYNPSILTSALFSQVQRFGLRTTIDKKSLLSGKLNGKRSDFTQMIQSYGFKVEVVRGV